MRLISFPLITFLKIAFTFASFPVFYTLPSRNDLSKIIFSGFDTSDLDSLKSFG